MFDLLGALAFALSTPAAQSVADYTHRPLIHQVRCSGSRGTAFRIGPTTFLSVAHVTDGKDCTIDGEPFTFANDGELDFAVIEVPTLRRGGAMRINCDGFVVGDYYFASGYAFGHPWQRTVTIRATGVARDGYRYLWGTPTVIPGMSGGPVMNARGEVVGLVNMYSPWLPLSFSLPLSETSMCKGEKL
jgi:hypothetical protein